MKMLRSLALFALLVALALPASAQFYEVVDLGDLGGGNTFPKAVNDNGVVVGRSDNANADARAFLWDDALLIREVVDGFLANGIASRANDINETGLIVGARGLEGSDLEPYSWTWDGVNGFTQTDLGALADGRLGEAMGVNASGVIVGYTETAPGQIQNPGILFADSILIRAFRWSGGSISAILNMIQGTEADAGDPVPSWGLDVNDAGAVVGAVMADGRLFGAHWDTADEIMIVDADGVTEGSADEANPLFRVNSSDLAAGAASAPFAARTQAYNFDATGGTVGAIPNTADLLPGLIAGTLPPPDDVVQEIEGAANDINDAGVSVGFSTIPANPGEAPRAVRWVGGAPEDLNGLNGVAASGWELLFATGINDMPIPWMVGIGFAPSGAVRAWLLRPTDAPPPVAAADPFKCYRVAENGRRTFQRRYVTLDDQFGSSNAQVLVPNELCAPVSKNQEPSTNPDAHLLCYKIRSDARRESRLVTDEDQFGTEELRVSGPAQLCLPAVKNDEGAANENHYQCYRARGNPPIGPFQAVLSDQFETKVTDLTGTSLHCNPVAKHDLDSSDYNGVIPYPGRHLKCYDIADAPGQAPFRGATVTTADQFGTLSLSVGTPTRFCEPACKNGECPIEPEVP
jgi:probable HAF family extracellular repeat protein